MHRDYFVTLARYNAWANRRVYQACEALGAVEYLRERPSSFGSLHATLNHILVADRIWIARVEGRSPPNLKPGQILYGDLIGLKIARFADDERIRNLVAGIPEAMLDQPLGYRDSQGRRLAAPLAIVLGHLFNHQTHHRGQVHSMLSAAEAAPPPLDLIEFAQDDWRRETGSRS